MQRMMLYLTAIRLAACLIISWLGTCYRLDRILPPHARQRYFPQLQASAVLQGCHAIFRQASQPSLIEELDRQRHCCRMLWKSIHDLPQRPQRVEGQTARRMLNCALQRSLELILGPGCWASDRGQIPAHGYPTLRDALLHWLENAGADRGQATFQSLRTTAGLIHATENLSQTAMTEEQRAAFLTTQRRLRSGLKQVSQNQIQQCIEQEYVSHQLAILAAPQALAQALATAPRINKPR